MSACFGTRALPRSTNGNFRKVSVNPTTDDPEKFWTDFNPKVLKMSESCLRDTPRTSKSFLNKKTLNIIEDSRRAGDQGRTGQYRDLKRDAVRAVSRDKEASVCVESARQWRATCGQPTFELPTEESGRCVSLGPHPAVLQWKRLMARY